MTLFLVVALGLAAQAAVQSGDTRQAELSPAATSNAALVKEARDAYNRGEKAVFLSIYEELARRRPGEVFTLYNLACGQALNGQSEAAVRTLEEILARRVASNIAADTDFEPIRQTEGYKSVLARMNALRKERVSSGAERAFTIPEKGFVAEGVAYDTITKAFFVSSVRRRRIVRVDRRGRIADFVPAGRDGLKSALGMHVDPQRRRLWVASEAVPWMDGYRKEDPRAAAVFEYDVDSGRLKKQHLPPEKGDPPGFDDLTLTPDGTVFVNDGFNSRIWRIPPAGSSKCSWPRRPSAAHREWPPRPTGRRSTFRIIEASSPWISRAGERRLSPCRPTFP